MNCFCFSCKPNFCKKYFALSVKLNQFATFFNKKTKIFGPKQITFFGFSASRNAVSLQSIFFLISRPFSLKNQKALKAFFKANNNNININ